MPKMVDVLSGNLNSFRGKNSMLLNHLIVTNRFIAAQKISGESSSQEGEAIIQLT